MMTKKKVVKEPELPPRRKFFFEYAQDQGFCEADKNLPAFLSEDYYDSAIIGMTLAGWGASESPQVIYDYEKVIALAMKANKWSYDEAAEWHDYNTQRSLAYYPGICPIFINVYPKRMK